jgi:hypothetical protein
MDESMDDLMGCSRFDGITPETAGGDGESDEAEVAGD